MADLVIRGAQLVDGTGAPGRPADVVVEGDRVTRVCDPGDGGQGGEVVDGDGLVLSPGFVDPHTHYDAQLFWDAHASPSNLHGVTTVIGGNCGFTLAPVEPGDADYLRRMMAKVEGMPLAALEQGVPWSWRTFPEYLDALEGRVGVNAGFLVGHCALRRFVMGERAVGEEAASAEVEEMARLLHESLAAGGLGFSTGRGTHTDGDGRPVASRWATDEELLALCRVVSEHEGTTLETILHGCLDRFSDEEVDLLTAMSLAGERPVNWNVMSVDAAEPGRHQRQLEASEIAAERGARVVALTMPTIVGMNMSFGTYCAFNLIPGWGEILSLPVEERKARLSDPEVRRRMAAQARSDEAGVLRRLADWAGYRIGDTFSETNRPLERRTVAEIAAERGDDDPFDTLLDIVIADDLRTVLWPSPTDNDDDSWKLRAEVWEHPHTMLGGSDAGAHLDRMCGAPYPTAFLRDVVRGRRLVTLERAVQMLTAEPAALFGLRDRGVVREGSYADVVLFDPQEVGAAPIKMRSDLPGESNRLFSGPQGVALVAVNGVVTVRDGEQVDDAVPGTVLRSGRDTYTVAVPGAA